MSGHHHYHHCHHHHQRHHYHQRHPHPHNLHYYHNDRAEELADGTRDRVTLGNLANVHLGRCMNPKDHIKFGFYLNNHHPNIFLPRLDRPVSGQEGPLQRKRPLLYHLQDQPG